GEKTKFAEGYTAALPFFKRAVELDPNFARALIALAINYYSRGDGGRAAEYARKAYELREKVSERERFHIESNYYLLTGELEKAVETFELFKQAYPRDVSNLGNTYGQLGNWEKALEEIQEAVRLAPNNGNAYAALGSAYASLNRLDEAEAVYKQAEERKLAGGPVGETRSRLFFLGGDGGEGALWGWPPGGKRGRKVLRRAGKGDP